MTKDEMMRNIQALAFAKTETELFLDSHPDCQAALTYYYETVDALRAVTEEYEAKYGPLTAAGVRGDTWTWINTPWPWQSDSAEVQN